MAIAEILNYVFGSTTLVSIYVAWASRKSEIKKAETDALKSMQEVYDTFVKQTQEEIRKLQTKIDELEKKLEQSKKCKNCEK